MCPILEQIPAARPQMDIMRAAAGRCRLLVQPCCESGFPYGEDQWISHCTANRSGLKPERRLARAKGDQCWGLSPGWSVGVAQNGKTVFAKAVN
jgi:hypothetical protein